MYDLIDDIFYNCINVHVICILFDWKTKLDGFWMTNRRTHILNTIKTRLVKNATCDNEIKKIPSSPKNLYLI